MRHLANIQDVFFWRLAGPVAPTGKAIVHWIGCSIAIKMCVLLCYPVSFHMLQLLLTGHPISSLYLYPLI